MAIAAVSTVSSFSLAASLQYTALFALLVTLLQQTSLRRWRTVGDIIADLNVAYWTLSYFILSGVLSVTFGFYPALTASRVSGFFVNPNMMGNIAALCALLGFALWSYTRHWSYLPVALALAAATVSSGSRTAIAALGIAGIIGLFRSQLVVRLAVLWLTAVCGCILILLQPLSGPGGSALFGASFARFDSEDISLSNRTEVWSIVLRLIGDNRAGLGFGASPSYFEHSGNALVSFLPGTSVYNSYLQWVLETGLVGIAPIAFLVIVVLLVIVMGRRAPLAAGLGAVLFAGLLIQVTESMIFGMGQVYPWLYWFIAVAAATCVDISRHDYRARQ